VTCGVGEAVILGVGVGVNPIVAVGVFDGVIDGVGVGVGPMSAVKIRTISSIALCSPK
jgi:hypothetical protein